MADQAPALPHVVTLTNVNRLLLPPVLPEPPDGLDQQAPAK